MNMEKALAETSETFSQRFLMLIQAVSGIRGLTALEMDGLEESQLLDEILSVLIQNLDIDKCSIFLLEEERLRCAAGKNWDHYIQQAVNKQRQSHTFRIGEGIMGMVAQNRRIYHCKNGRQDGHFLPVIHSDMDKSPGSLICAPIMLGKKVLGVLNVSHPDPDFFHSWQEHIVDIHANILAQMLHNHRLMNNMRHEVKKRTKELENALQLSENLKSQFEVLSLVDDLTQLHNRRYFFEEVPRLLGHAMRHSEPFSMLLLDLDSFKQINDTHGHESGDHVLKDVGQLLNKETRTGDIVARLGGEEFAFVLPSTDTQGASKFAERIRRSVAELTWYYDKSNFNITMSIGITGLNNRKCEADIILQEMLKESDQALYQCKRQGKNQVTVFSKLEKEKPGS
ncbi:MAG: diguanylate cyclase [Gammaproteobacteria bacterium]